MVAGLESKLEASKLNGIPTTEDYSQNKCDPDLFQPQECDPNYKLRPFARQLWILGIGHACAVYGLYLCFTSAKLLTLIFAYALHTLGKLAITAGSHRLWSHKAYKARRPLRVLLMLLQTMAFHGHVVQWSRDHRVHHKYSDTDADPHNARRGFFFSHIGWLLVKKHPAVAAACKCIDISDLLKDPVLAFQKKYYFTALLPMFAFLLPTLIPHYLWGETKTNAFFIAGMLRWILTLHVISLVNSAAHKWGNKPYDKSIVPVGNGSIALITLGEGWHNFHHVFPWDYRAAELGRNGNHLTTNFIDLMAKIGWAYDLKTASPSLVSSRMERTGDGS